MNNANPARRRTMAARVTAWAAVGMAGVGLLASGCDGGDGGGSAGGGGDQKTLAFVTNNASDFWTIARAGTRKADEELDGVTVNFQIPSDGTAASQQRIVDDLLATGVDGIAISPVDPANQTALLNRAAEQGLLVTHDSDAPESNRAFYVGTDNVAAGRQAGETLKKALPDGGKIMMFVGTLDAQNASDRLKGFREALEGSNVEIIDVRTDDTDRVRAKANVQDTMVKYPDVAGLVGLWSYNGPAILNAVREAGKAGQIKIVTFDEEPETLAGVKSGDVYATIVQQPYEFGHRAITLMAKHLAGDTSVVPESKQVFIPTLVVDQASVDEFSAKLQALRGQ